MKKIHYINYGTAKTATSWIWHSLIASTEIDYKLIKEPKLSLCDDFSEYKKFFSSYNISLNFQPNLWKLDLWQLMQLSNLATHTSIIFRNPYSYANSLYNFWKSFGLIANSKNFVNDFKIYFDYLNILQRLPKNILVLYFDDIQVDQQKTLDTITSFIDIHHVKAIGHSLNKTFYNENLNFSSDDITLINTYIDKFQDYTKKDVSHWKINV